MRRGNVEICRTSITPNCIKGLISQNFKLCSYSQVLWETKSFHSASGIWQVHFSSFMKMKSSSRICWKKWHKQRCLSVIHYFYIFLSLPHRNKNILLLSLMDANYHHFKIMILTLLRICFTASYLGSLSVRSITVHWEQYYQHWFIAILTWKAEDSYEVQHGSRY